MLDDGGEPFRQVHVAQEPDQPVEQELLHRHVEIELQLAGYPVVELVDRVIEFAHAVAVVHRRERERDVGGGGAGLIGDAHHERRPAAIDHRIGKLGGDDLAAQPMPRDGVGEALLDGVRKITAELAGKIRIVRHL